MRRRGFPSGTYSPRYKLSVLDFVRGDWAGALSHGHTASVSTRKNELQCGASGRELFFGRWHTRAIATAHLHCFEKAFARRYRSAAGENIRRLVVMLGLVVRRPFHARRATAGQLYPLRIRELNRHNGAVVGCRSHAITQTIAGLAAAGARSGKPPKIIFRVARRPS